MTAKTLETTRNTEKKYNTALMDWALFRVDNAVRLFKRRVDLIRSLDKENPLVSHAICLEFDVAVTSRFWSFACTSGLDNHQSSFPNAQRSRAPSCPNTSHHHYHY